jgi:hypothetical protein
MKTQDIFNTKTSQKLNETLQKTFGKKLNLETFSLEQLHDVRNKLRTQIHQFKQGSNFNETLENETYTKAQWMLDTVNAEISEREEFTTDAQQLEVEEGFNTEAEATMNKIANSGDDGYDMIQDGLDGLLGGEVEIMLQDMYDDISRENRLHPDDDSEQIIDRMMDRIESDYGDSDSDSEEGGETDDSYALASAGHGSDEDYESFQYEGTQGENMRKVTEGEIQQAQSIVTAKTMVDRVGRWIEELSGMENDTLLTLGDQIRDEMGQEQAKSFLSAVAPAIQQALENLKTTRETLATGVRTLTGEQQPAEIIGAEPEADIDAELAPAAPDEMNEPTVEPELGDEFGASEPATGGAEEAGRAKRESVEYSNRLLKVLAG